MRTIGVAGQDEAETMAEFTAEYGLDGFDHIADRTGQIWVVFGVNAQPSFVFINDDGTIKRHVGGMTVEDLDAQMQWLESN